MKLHNLYIGLGLLMLGGTLGSCSSDYLDQPPITYISDSEIGQSIEAARAALYGACQAMYIGTYADNNDRNNSGEAWFQTYYGDAGSPDFWDSFLWGYQSEMQNWTLMVRNSMYGSRNAWMYGYNIINQANTILAVIDDVPAAKEEVDFVKAQCLTLRAHAYVRLMQVYAPRFEDTDDGKKICLILRDTPGTDAMLASSYADCIKFIYNDLDEAIRLFDGSTVKRQFGYEPDVNVAKGIYSRIALLNHDWKTAYTMAAEARASYPIMSAEEYKQGFADPNAEWLWYNDPDQTYVGYNSWGATYSCNGAYSTAYNWAGAGCISLRIYDAIYSRHQDDVRCELFWTPDKVNKYVNLKIKETDFWNPKVVNTEYGYMFGPGMDEKMSAAISLFARHMNPNPEEFGVSAFGVDTSLTDENAGRAIARRTWFTSLSNNQVMNVCQPGAQVKFWSYASQLGASSHPFMRGAELLLTEAEAQYEDGNPTKARELLIELNKQRIPNYTCTLNGEELREEIRLYRRIELWGEGDCWFSFKRWNIGVKREKWVANDPSSDTFLSAYEGEWDPSYGKGWRFQIPTSETNYNPLLSEQLDIENNKYYN